MSAPDPRPAPPAGSTSGSTSSSASGTAREVEAVFRLALRDVLVLLGVLAVVGLAVGWFAAGTAGVWGALLGVGLALVFSGTTIVSMLRTAHATPQAMAGVVMGAWLVKVVVVVAALAVLRGMDFYSRPVLAGVLAVGVIGSALLDYRAVQRARIPYVGA
ncbi:hypothetical protein [Cellulomonas marina]|uniref:ATP synthase protein I n=1 Tax=Cellulomonas marina TaxID=988821 RepID=A0A1I1ASS5_9CELL|nr:hypothetical protein [Cellulomonas marina]GIG30246.1 hypothetical protein Cma02nite_28460 [Cellulomonas marina]SFB41129.1 hypothetical protein SAMN05421867_12229 [Cellulomonas marina]